MNDTYQLRSSMGISKIAQESIEKIAESREKINESLFDIMKTTALAVLLSIPGIVDADEIAKGLDGENTNTVQVSSPKVQRKIYNILGKDRAQTAIMINVIARTLMAECGSESREGIDAVATVIWNRSKGDKSKFLEVIFKPKQFSCWNKFTDKDKMNFVIKPHGRALTNPSTWEYCVKVATKMVDGTFVPSGDWTHYYAQKKCNPSWSTKMHDKKIIGNHTFGTV